MSHLTFYSEVSVVGKLWVMLVIIWGLVQVNAGVVFVEDGKLFGSIFDML